MFGKHKERGGAFFLQCYSALATVRQNVLKLVEKINRQARGSQQF